MWEFITNNVFVILLVSFVSFIIVYIFLKQGSSKKKIELAAKPKEEAKQEVVKEAASLNQVAQEVKSISQEIVAKTIKEEEVISQINKTPRGERQESLDNFKNERLKSHVLKLKPNVQAVILKK